MMLSEPYLGDSIGFSGPVARFAPLDETTVAEIQPVRSLVFGMAPQRVSGSQFVLPNLNGLVELIADGTANHVGTSQRLANLRLVHVKFKAFELAGGRATKK